MKFITLILFSLLLLSCASIPSCDIPDSNIIDLYFIPRVEFVTIESNYIEGNEGFFWYYRTKEYEIKKANVFVNSEKPIGNRKHLLREELTQSFGLFKDSNSYNDSIFYSGGSLINEYSELDKEIIEILYLSDIKIGMSKEIVKDILQDKYSEEIVDYFIGIAFGSEYNSNQEFIAKWMNTVIINVHGHPTVGDIEELNKIVNELRGLTNLNLIVN